MEKESVNNSTETIICCASFTVFDDIIPQNSRFNSSSIGLAAKSWMSSTVLWPLVSVLQLMNQVRICRNEGGEHLLSVHLMKITLLISQGMATSLQSCMPLKSDEIMKDQIKLADFIVLPKNDLLQIQWLQFGYFYNNILDNQDVKQKM